VNTIHPALNIAHTVNELGSLLQKVLWHIEEFGDLILCCYNTDDSYSRDIVSMQVSHYSMNSPRSQMLLSTSTTRSEWLRLAFDGTN